MSEYVPETQQVRIAYSIIDGNVTDALIEERGRAFDRWIAALEREVEVRTLREVADRLPGATEGSHREGTSNWTARDRDIYSLAIEEAAGALLFRADLIESQETL